MSVHPFLARLERGALLADGAMGAELYARGVSPSQCYDALNLTDPELVQRVHLDYLCAGAEIIETNTFGANGIGLAAFGLEGQVAEINRQGGRIARYARDIAGSGAFVAGAIGPLNGGGTDPERARTLYREQVGGLLDGGVDLILLETFGDLHQLCLAAQLVRETCDLPLIAQATFDAKGRTPYGQSASEVTRALMHLGVDVIGVNCSVGPDGVLAVARQMLAAGARHVSAMPNAGMPMHAAGRIFYLTHPSYIADRVPDFHACGVSILGGCCGTTPAHIAAMRKALDALVGTPAARLVRPVAQLMTKPDPGPVAESTGLKRMLDAGHFVTVVELSPPKGLNHEGLLRHARALAESGVVDLINVTDSPTARVRMDALASCHLIQADTGMETVLHLTTRDHNLMGIQAHLSGAHALGVRNILALTGDPPSMGNVIQATGVFDIDSVGLVKLISQMKQGYDILGNDMGRPAGFCVGVAVDPTRADLVTEARHLRDKIAAGAEFVMTQPIYDLSIWRRFCEVYGEPITIPVLLGLLPLLSQRHAEFLHTQVPGITLTPEVLERMRAAGPNGRDEGVRLAQEILLEAQGMFQGVYVMISYNRHDQALDVLSVLAPQGVRQGAML